MFETILTDTSSLTIGTVLLCTAVSLVLGLGIAYVYMKKGSYTKNFVIALALLPALVQVVVMMVNGNLGTGVGCLVRSAWCGSVPSPAGRYAQFLLGFRRLAKPCGGKQTHH